MKKIIFLKITAVVSMLLNLNSAKAQTLSKEEVLSLQYMIENKILIEKDGELQLSQSLRDSGLVEYLSNTKTTNCTGGGSCL